MKYYKVLGKGGIPCNGGTGKWNLPKNGKPGKWMPKIDNIIPCQRGYHLCRAEDLIYWLNQEIYEAEGRGKFIRHDNNKDVFPEARLIRKIETWNDKTIRLFAADCAEHVLHIFEKQYPNDKRPKEAIQAVRDFVNGKISDAARDAAWDAAGYAGWDATWDAAGYAAGEAAGAAARAAAREAAGAAAWEAAGAAAREAAGAAAGDAAREAAGAAAGAAARAVAGAAAREAAGYAAWDAEKKWQTSKLMEYLIRQD